MVKILDIRRLRKLLSKERSITLVDVLAEEIYEKISLVKIQDLGVDIM